MPLIEGDVEKYYSVPSTSIIKRCERRKRIENRNFKQTIKQSYNAVITNKTWKQFKPKTRNQRNSISFLSA